MLKFWGRPLCQTKAIQSTGYSGCGRLLLIVGLALTAAQPALAQNRRTQGERSFFPGRNTESDDEDESDTRNRSSSRKPEPPPEPTLDELRQRAAALRTQKVKLEQEIADKREQLEALRVWQEPHFVLGNNKTPVAVGLKEERGSYRLLCAARGTEEVPSAIGVARKSNIPRIATDRARTIAQRVYDTVEIGQSIPTDVQSQLETDVWTAWQYLDVGPRDPLNFVVFRTANWNTQQVGVVRTVSDAAVTIRQPRSRDTSIQQADVQIGSLWADTGRDIVPALEVGDSFLDYCLLNVAQKLSLEDDQRGFRRVAVHTNIDRLVKDFEEGTRTRLYEIHYGRGNGDFQPNSRERSLPPSQLLRQYARAIEDEVYERLVDMEIPVVEREYAEQVRLEQSYETVPDIRDLARLADATHLVIAELDDALSGSSYRLSVRLVDLATGTDRWAGSDDEAVPVVMDANPFSLQTGQPAFISLKPPPEGEEPTTPIRIDGFESPLSVPLVGGSTSSADAKPLVLIEGREQGQVIYRPFFSRQTRSIPEELISLEELDNPNKDLKNNAQLIRYVVWRLSRKALTPAGRIIHLQGSQSATVSLGRQDGVKPGDVLRVLRQFSIPDSPGEAAGLSPREVLLPARLTVSEVLEDTSRVRIAENEFQSTWTQAEYEPQIGDVVVSRVEPRRQIGVYPTGWRPPSSNVLISQLNWNNPVQRQRNITTADSVSKLLQETMALGLQKISPPQVGEVVIGRNGDVDMDETLSRAGAAGITHMLGGEIEWVAAHTFRVTMKLREIRNSGSDWTFGDSLETVTFELGDRELSR